MIPAERIEAIFEQMGTFVLELANDPSSLGPRYFQDLIATCRNYLNSVSLVASELTRAKLSVSSELRKLETVFELEFDHLLSNDPHVKSLANIKDRESMARNQLRAQSTRIEALRDNLKAIEAATKVVSHRNRELHATMDAIKNQRRLMQTEIDTGSFYGDERVRNGSPGPGPIGGVEFDEDEINAALSEAAGASAPPALPPGPLAPAPEAEVTLQDSEPQAEPQKATNGLVGATDEDAAALQTFLGDPPTEEPPTLATVEPSKSAAQMEEEDLSSLLDTI